MLSPLDESHCAMRVGLTGGIGSGKSEVARILGSLGAFIIDTDELAREAVAPESDGLRQIARIWPNVVRDDRLDRAELAEIVFADPAALDRLNAIVHPHVRRLAAEAERNARPGQLIVQVVPLLFETGYDANMDKSILVIAPVEQRIARVVARDRSTVERVRARMAAQIDPNEARKRTAYLIENDGDVARMQTQVERIYAALTT
jgi:dephospho-CoA kinase